jgi:hypothetical protein
MHLEKPAKPAGHMGDPVNRGQISVSQQGPRVAVHQLQTTEVTMAHDVVQGLLDGGQVPHHQRALEQGKGRRGDAQGVALGALPGNVHVAGHLYGHM